MAKKKKLTPEQELQQYRESLIESFERWGEIRLHGCNDPAWTDGQNMNLVKNHIIWHSFKIMEICAVSGLPLPPEYYLEMPPEAPMGYMANLDQTERVERLRKQGDELTMELY